MPSSRPACKKSNPPPLAAAGLFASLLDFLDAYHQSVDGEGSSLSLGKTFLTRLRELHASGQIARVGADDFRKRVRVALGSDIFDEMKSLADPGAHPILPDDLARAAMDLAKGSAQSATSYLSSLYSDAIRFAQSARCRDILSAPAASWSRKVEPQADRVQRVDSPQRSSAQRESDQWDSVEQADRAQQADSARTESEIEDETLADASRRAVGFLAERVWPAMKVESLSRVLAYIRSEEAISDLSKEPPASWFLSVRACRGGASPVPHEQAQRMAEALSRQAASVQSHARTPEEPAEFAEADSARWFHLPGGALNLMLPTTGAEGALARADELAVTVIRALDTIPKTDDGEATTKLRVSLFELPSFGLRPTGFNRNFAESQELGEAATDALFNSLLIRMVHEVRARPDLAIEFEEFSFGGQKPPSLVSHSPMVWVAKNMAAFFAGLTHAQGSLFSPASRSGASFSFDTDFLREILDVQMQTAAKIVSIAGNKKDPLCGEAALASGALGEAAAQFQNRFNADLARMTGHASFAVEGVARLIKDVAIGAQNAPAPLDIHSAEETQRHVALFTDLVDFAASLSVAIRAEPLKEGIRLRGAIAIGQAVSTDASGGEKPAYGLIAELGAPNRSETQAGGFEGTVADLAIFFLSNGSRLGTPEDISRASAALVKMKKQMRDLAGLAEERGDDEKERQGEAFAQRLDELKRKLNALRLSVSPTE